MHLKWLWLLHIFAKMLQKEFKFSYFPSMFHCVRPIRIQIGKIIGIQKPTGKVKKEKYIVKEMDKGGTKQTLGLERDTINKPNVTWSFKRFISINSHQSLPPGSSFCKTRPTSVQKFQASFPVLTKDFGFQSFKPTTQFAKA